MAEVKQCDNCERLPNETRQVHDWHISPGYETRTVDLCSDCADQVTLREAFRLGRYEGSGHARGVEILDSLRRVE